METASWRSLILRWWSTPPAGLTYGFAVLSVTVAVIITWRMEMLVQAAAPVSPLLGAAVFSAWFGGIKPALLSIALAVLAFDYYSLPPIHSVAAEVNQLPRLLSFALSALFVGGLTAAQRRTAALLRHTRDDLQGSCQELQRIDQAPHTETSERQRVETQSRRSEAYLAEA